MKTYQEIVEDEQLSPAEEYGTPEDVSPDSPIEDIIYRWVVTERHNMATVEQAIRGAVIEVLSLIAGDCRRAVQEQGRRRGES